MNARSRKQKLRLFYAKVLKTSDQPSIITEEIQRKPAGNPFALLFQDLKPIQELSEDDDAPPVIQKKTRGRPRKYFPADPTKITHRMDNDTVVCLKTINNTTRMAMIADFNFHYCVNKIPLQRALDRVIQTYKVTYKQAHQILEGEF